MNSLLNISRDSEIFKVQLAELNEVQDFEEGACDEPELNPLRPFFGKRFWITNWHGTLREKFVAHLQKVRSKNFDEAEEDLVAELFDERIGRLRREWIKQKNTTEEEAEAGLVKRAMMNRRASRRVWASNFHFRAYWRIEDIPSRSDI